MVTFFVWGLLSLYLQAPLDHDCGTEAWPERRTRCGDGWAGLVRWASRGMLQALAAQRSTLSIVSQHPSGPKHTYLRQICVVARLSRPAASDPLYGQIDAPRETDTLDPGAQGAADVRNCCRGQGRILWPPVTSMCSKLIR
jgi:hypothetical protein